MSTTDQVLAKVKAVDHELPTIPFDRHILLMARVEICLWELLGLCKRCAETKTTGSPAVGAS